VCFLCHQPAPNQAASPSTQTTIMQTLQQRPISAMFLYIDAKKVEYMQKRPYMSDSEVSAALSNKYTRLPDGKKVSVCLYKHKYQSQIFTALD
jgi:hypothetical protein